MKKLTKKAIKEAANYMVMIDKLNAPGFETEVLEADNLLDAMDEASEYFNAATYLLAILEKTGETVEDNGLTYREIMRSRTENRWATIKSEGYTEGSTWGRYFYDDGDELTAILACAK